MENKPIKEYVRRRDMSPEAGAFVDQWVAEFNERIAVFSMAVGTVYLLGSFPLIPINTLPELRSYALWAHVVILSILAGIEAYRRAVRAPVARIILVFQPILSVMLAFYAHETLAGADDPNYRWLASVSLVGINTLLVLGAPSQSYGWLINSVIMISSAALMFWANGMGSFHEISLLFAALLVVFSKFAMTIVVHRVAYRSYLIQDLARSAERQKHQHELELARRIQSSMDLPKFQRLAGGTTATFIQVVRERVGGDWAALREFSDGTTVALIADAAGKGMQAALVVHAVQSLWTSTLDHPRFDASAWLTQVNATLFHLGAKEPHAVTIGLLEINEGHKLRYWSAGHLPLIILQDDPRGQKRVHRLFGYGDMLGLDRTAFVRPVRHELTSMSSEIILATDGVLPMPSRCHDKEVVKLLDKLARRQDDAPLTDVDDDQTVIWLSRGRAA